MNTEREEAARDSRVEWTVEQWAKEHPLQSVVTLKNGETVKVIGYEMCDWKENQGPYLVGRDAVNQSEWWPALDIVEPWTAGEVQTIAGNTVRIFCNPVGDLGLTVENHIDATTQTCLFEPEQAKELQAHLVQYLEGLEK